MQHPHIVPIFAVGMERGVHFYAMQFIEGQALDKAIAQLRRDQQSAAWSAAVSALDKTRAWPTTTVRRRRADPS